MPAPRNRPRVTLCAAVTADGKLDAAPGPLPAPQPGDVWLTDDHAAVNPGEPSQVVKVAGVRENLARRLRELRTRENVRRVFCGGGPRLFRRLFDAALVDEVCLRVRPRIDGRRGAATLSGAPGEYFPASIPLRLLKMEVRGGECVLHYRVRRTPSRRPAAA